MKQELKYNGLSANPSDHEAPDGDLSEAINLVPEDGQLKPLFQPKDLAHLPSGYKIEYIHKTANFTHYILSKISFTGTGTALRLYWLDESVISDASQLPVDTETIANNASYIHDFFKLVPHPVNHQMRRFALGLNSINSIGNTLVALMEDGMHYILWKGDSGVYKYLGKQFPELQLSFGLQGSALIGEEFTVDHRKSVTGHLPNYNHPPSSNEPLIEYSGTNDDMREFIRTITEQIMSKVNLVVNEQTEKGKFIMPFFVRYAYRLFDGSLTRQSSPILMVTGSDVAPFVSFNGFRGSTSGSTTGGLEGLATVKTLLFDLDYQAENYYSYEMNEWTDIIKSVDIFISAPIFTYDQSGDIKGLEWRHASDFGYTLSKITTGEQYYFKQYYLRQLGYNYSDSDALSYKLPKKYDSNGAAIRDCGNFYLLKSIEIGDIATTRQKIDVPEGHLSSLVNRETLPDDYYSHDNLIPKYSFNYNSRFNIANIKREVSQPNAPSSYISYVEKTRVVEQGGPQFYDKYFTLYIFIKSDGSDIVVESISSSLLAAEYPFVYFFYPNPNAYKAYMVDSDGNVYVLPLKSHDFLNGAYFFDGWNPTIGMGAAVPSLTDDNTILLPNKLYSSEINNPFYFPATGIVSVGTGTILGISAAAKALSQGQFGQFPLYAFTTDGVWALEVSSTGTFSARQPITRDVCTNPDSITQLDNAVLFATDRGIMHIAGSQATCITDVIATEYPFNALSLPHLADLHAIIHSGDTCLPTQPFLTFLKDCRMLYDYLHQRVVVFNPLYSYSYVFSLKSKQWGMMFCDLQEPVNSYPDALAMAYDSTNGDKLVSFSGTDETVSKGLLVTRPLKFGDGNTFKTIRTIIQRGMFSRSDVKLVLYGSRDLEHWHVVASSTTSEIRNVSGSPYKYLRIAAINTFTPDKSVYGATLEVIPKQTNRLH